MIKFIPHLPVKPTHLARMFTAMFRAIEQRMPWVKDDIASVWAKVVDWTDGTLLGPDNIDIEALKEVLGSEGGFSLSELHQTHGFRPLYRDDVSLWIESGQTLHRGLFKRQPLEEDTYLPRAVNAATALDSTCPPSNPGTSGLERDTWHYVYCDTSQAGSEPRIIISTIPPENRTGHGWEHPTTTAMAYLGPFKTEDTDDAFIIPFQRHEDWYYWTDVLHGPEEPEDLMTEEPTSGFITLDINEWAPPTARAVAVTLDFSTSGATFVNIRSVGETQHYAFDEAATEHARIVVPVRQRDSEGEFTGTSIQVETGADDMDLGIVGFQEIQR